jgi:hypothetical protein
MRRSILALLLAAAGCSFPEYAVQEAEHVPVETCRDGLLSVNEIDVDCGPACGAGCATGKSCSSDQECQSGFCAQGLCAMPSCSDNAKNRAETDVDCGGSDGCKACGVGQRCATAFDCDGGACVNGRCLAASCSDGIQNQDESDVDCGGARGCDRCQTKQHCVTTGDCSKAVCSQGRCQAVGCDDGLRNGDETGLDCGGSCPSCPDSSGCSTSADCRSLVCSPQTLVCLAATCSDAVQNGTEPSTDCGADCAQKCPNLVACAIDADCQSGACTDKRCVPKSATGAALSTSSWIASASATGNQDSVPRKAIDGDPNTHWTSGTSQVPGMWFELDMLQAQAFFAIELTCLTNDDYPRSLRVLLSEDGQNFTAATGTLAGEKTLRINLVSAHIARYIKLELEQNTGGLWWRIDELRVLQ